jgi:aryl-alcohol dehydrogenase-like predicted oxidoreductase
MTSHGTFATAINCMDGRAQIPVINWMKKEFKVDYVDSITEPGPIRILAENKDNYALESIKKRLAVSLNKHGSKHIAVVAHHDCAGNPVDKQTQLGQIAAAIKTVKSWGYDATFVGLWVNDAWSVEKVA